MRGGVYQILKGKKNVGAFDTRYSICQDDDICMRLSRNGNFDLIDKPIAKVIGDTNSMTLNKLKLAKGWEFFFKQYRADILKYCGFHTWGKHMIKLSILFYDASHYRSAFLYNLKGSLLIFFFPNRFGESRYYNFKVMKKSFKRWLKN
jgi:hypothetical protein